MSKSKIWVNKYLIRRMACEREVRKAKRDYDKALVELDACIKDAAQSFSEFASYDEWPVAPKGEWAGQKCPVCGGDMHLCDFDHLLKCSLVLTCGVGRMKLHPADLKAEFGNKRK